MTDVSYDYSLLRGLIVSKYGTINKFIEAINENDQIISRTMFSHKLNNKFGFDQKEIRCICKYLNINNSDIPRYFFAQVV